MRNSGETRQRILVAAMQQIRTRGYSATKVDDICAAAGITKGAFFHHFSSKEEMATAAAHFFSDYAGQVFASAPYQQIADPAQKFLGYLDYRRSLLRGETPDYTCLLGTIVQEAHVDHPALRAACQAHIWHHAETLVPLIGAALAACASHPDGERSLADEALDLALFSQATLQGAFILAKASASPEPAIRAVSYLREFFLDRFGLTENP